MPQLSEEEIRMLMVTLQELRGSVQRLDATLERVNERMSKDHDIQIDMRADVDTLLEDRDLHRKTRQGVGLALLGTVIANATEWLVKHK